MLCLCDLHAQRTICVRFLIQVQEPQGQSTGAGHVQQDP